MNEHVIRPPYRMNDLVEEATGVDIMGTYGGDGGDLAGAKVGVERDYTHDSIVVCVFEYSSV